jgi:hypothetical protein
LEDVKKNNSLRNRNFGMDKKPKLKKKELERLKKLGMAQQYRLSVLANKYEGSILNNLPF